MAIFPQSYRDWDCPAILYNGMIIVTNAHPIAVREE
jgi:hypothetical protein